MANLKWLRLNADMDQSVLAERVGVSSIQISNYETGRSRPRSKILQRIAKVLHVNIEDILL